MIVLSYGAGVQSTALLHRNVGFIWREVGKSETTQGENMTIDKMIGYLDYTQAHRATHFISEKEIVRVTRRLVGGKIEKNGRTRDYSVTIGKPNYEEREFLNAAKKVGEPFPVKKRK